MDKSEYHFSLINDVRTFSGSPAGVSRVTAAAAGLGPVQTPASLDEGSSQQYPPALGSD